MASYRIEPIELSDLELNGNFGDIDVSIKSLVIKQLTLNNVVATLIEQPEAIPNAN